MQTVSPDPRDPRGIRAVLESTHHGGQGTTAAWAAAVWDPGHGPCRAVLYQAHTHSLCWVWCPVAAHAQEQTTLTTPLALSTLANDLKMTPAFPTRPRPGTQSEVRSQQPGLRSRSCLLTRPRRAPRQGVCEALSAPRSGSPSSGAGAPAWLPSVNKEWSLSSLNTRLL